MSLTITLSPDAENRLRERARAAGVEPGVYAMRLLELSLRPPRSLDELGHDVHRRFVESGTTDEQLAEELERAKHEMREERRGRRAS